MYLSSDAGGDCARRRLLITMEHDFMVQHSHFEIGKGKRTVSACRRAEELGLLVHFPPQNLLSRLASD